MVRDGRLSVTWAYGEGRHRRETVERLAESFLASLRKLIAHCLAPDAGGFTPSDFPAAALDQKSLDRLLGKIGRRNEAVIEDVYRLSPLQEGMLFESLYAPEADAYVVQVSWTLGGDLDPAALRRAWEELVRRHAVLRTSFHWEELDQPHQVVHRQVELPWIEEDWRGVPAEERRSGVC